jgi:hypothetical protein
VGNKMKVSLLEEYMDKIKEMEDKEYLFGVVYYSIAPTLLGYKPSSIITLYNNERNLNLLWEKYKIDFNSQQEISFYEVKKREKSITVLFYNTEDLKKVIYKCDNINFLKEFGYRENFSLDEILKILRNRFSNMCPHEIGIFLGFPLEDVICFIKSPEKKCLLCGYWKAYNNVQQAKEQFYKFDNAKQNIMNLILKGTLPSDIIYANI